MPKEGLQELPVGQLQAVALPQSAAQVLDHIVDRSRRHGDALTGLVHPLPYYYPNQVGLIHGFFGGRCGQMILSYIKVRGILIRMSGTSSKPDFLNGVPELIILRLLSEQPAYGYELVQRIRRDSGEQLNFGEGCIYPILHRLEAQGYLSSRREQVAGRSRVVYRVTRRGSARLVDATAQWQRVVDAVGLILQGGKHGQPGIASHPA
jgi:PadR family transcriptional regulator PadR